MTNCPQDLINCPGYNFPVHRYPHNGCGCPPPNSPVICIGAVLPNKQDIVFSNSNLFLSDGKNVRGNMVHDIIANEDAATIKYDQNITLRKPYEAAPKVGRHYTDIGLDNAQGKTIITYATNGGTESRMPSDTEQRSPAIIDGNLLEPDIDYFFPKDVCTLPPPPIPCPSPTPSPYYQTSPSPSVSTYYQVSPSPYYQTSPSPEINYPSPSIYYPPSSPPLSPPPSSEPCTSDNYCDFSYCIDSGTCGDICSNCTCPPGFDCVDDIGGGGVAGCRKLYVTIANVTAEQCESLFGYSQTGGWTVQNIFGYCCDGSCSEYPCSSPSP